MSKRWSIADIPDLSGRVAVVTGANSGLGLQTTRGLATAGARVVMACRSRDRGQQALETLQAELPGAELDLRELDLADLSSVRAFAEGLGRDHERVDILVNNAGVMAIPHRETADGFEMQLGTNHLGHFALTGLLLDRLLMAGAARVVTVSSLMHWTGRIHFEDLDFRRDYRKWPAYSQSKLANLLFTFELQRRLQAAGAKAIAVASHPGYSDTNLQTGHSTQHGGFVRSVLGLGNRVFAMDPSQGALPSLYAATAPDVQGGDFFGPGGLAEVWGHPAKARPSWRARDEETAKRLWDISVDRTGVGYEALTAKAA